MSGPRGTRATSGSCGSDGQGQDRETQHGVDHHVLRVWHECCLAGSEASFGFDFDVRSLTVYDDGRTAGWPLYIKSFMVRQNGIHESIKRATGTTEARWMRLPGLA
ncbi:hypothetical protein VTK73DRAFT_4415 [Phialemonium thermophilum]|uniref:Uncharacterized protein n=1 Tax=Phialemonium thermophilum TaxID=223376 RepID=A0ABR3V9M0_9PEZI